MQMKNIYFHLSMVDFSVTDSEIWMQVETTEQHLMHHSILLHAKGLFEINNGTFLQVKQVD